jgi:hypothetical protein
MKGKTPINSRAIRNHERQDKMAKIITRKKMIGREDESDEPLKPQEIKWCTDHIATAVADVGCMVRSVPGKYVSHKFL